MIDNPSRPVQSETEIQQTLQSDAQPEQLETAPLHDSLPEDNVRQSRAEPNNRATSEPPGQSAAPTQASASAPPPTAAPAPVTAQAIATGSAAPAEQPARKSSRKVKPPDRPGMVTTTTARRSTTKKTSRQVEAQDSDENDEEDEELEPVIPPKKRGRPLKKRTPASRARSNRSAAPGPSIDVNPGEDNNPSIDVSEMTNMITDLAQRSFNVAESFGKFLRQHHPDEEAAIADVEASMQEVSERYSKKRKAVSQDADDVEAEGMRKGRGDVKQTGRIPALYYSDQDD